VISVPVDALSVLVQTQRIVPWSSVRPVLYNRELSASMTVMKASTKLPTVRVVHVILFAGPASDQGLRSAPLVMNPASDLDRFVLCNAQPDSLGTRKREPVNYAMKLGRVWNVQDRMRMSVRAVPLLTFYCMVNVDESVPRIRTQTNCSVNAFHVMLLAVIVLGRTLLNALPAASHSSGRTTNAIFLVLKEAIRVLTPEFVSLATHPAAPAMVRLILIACLVPWVPFLRLTGPVRANASHNSTLITSLQDVSLVTRAAIRVPVRWRASARIVNRHSS